MESLSFTHCVTLAGVPGSHLPSALQANLLPCRVAEAPSEMDLVSWALPPPGSRPPPPSSLAGPGTRGEANPGSHGLRQGQL